MDDILNRVKLRINNVSLSDEVISEYVKTVYDRLCLRLKEDILPDIFYSVCVDAVVKMYNRIYYEGISSESGGNISTSFVEDILNEYNGEIESYLSLKKNNNEDGTRKVVRFL